ncbi:hypothetical protein [Desulfatibacillum aliphaticivorans]|nr:hypothetical protein [Desulfatibacillum aliphaticivorans]
MGSDGSKSVLKFQDKIWYLYDYLSIEKALIVAKTPKSGYGVIALSSQE